MAKVRLDDLGDGVRLLTLADPDRRNAIGAQMASELVAVADAVDADRGARALVVTGQGPAFCAGADLPALFGDPDRPVAQTRTALHDYYRSFLRVFELGLPTIAAVNGPAVGAGLNLALACDLRVAGAQASFGVTFTRIGLHPGGGCSWFLVRLIGAGAALRTLLLGETLDAEQAVAAGLADGPEDDAVAAALDVAGRIARLDPDLARHVKRGVRLAAAGAGFDAVLEYESWAQAASTRSPVLREWVDRFRG